MRYEIRFSCISHIGNVRSVNQDNFICNGIHMEIDNTQIEFPLKGSVNSKTDTVFGIFDGMGGEQCGEIAAYIAAKEASQMHFSKDDVFDLTSYCKRANDKICEYAENNNICAMGTTAAMLLFSKSKITLCNIGDSKIFWFSNGKFEQISEDHVAISPFGKKPPLTQNLGIPPSLMLIEPYLSQGIYKNDDKYLICSDGLTDMLNLDEIKEFLEMYSIEEASMNLTKKALENGGRDNITVILVEIKRKRNKLLSIFNR